MVDEDVENENTRMHVREQEPVRMTCPVCGKILRNQLPTIQTIFEENLYHVGSIRIVDSVVMLEHFTRHYYDEEEDHSMEDPHTLVYVFMAVFDNTGVCTAFDIQEVRPGR